MRLIDADAIPWDVDGVGFIPVIGKDEIDAMPEAVVRCKDCKYGQRLTDANGLHYMVCDNPFGHGIMVENHNFCAWGERREEG